MSLRSDSLSIYWLSPLLICLSTGFLVCWSVCLLGFLSVSLSVYWVSWLIVYLSTCLLGFMSVNLSVVYLLGFLFVSLSTGFPVCYSVRLLGFKCDNLSVV